MISSQEFWDAALVTAPSVFLHAGQGSDPDKNNEFLEISLGKTIQPPPKSLNLPISLDHLGAQTYLAKR
jgi:hypothetical protein